MIMLGAGPDRNSYRKLKSYINTKYEYHLSLFNQICEITADASQKLNLYFGYFKFKFPNILEIYNDYLPCLVHF